MFRTVNKPILLAVSVPILATAIPGLAFAQADKGIEEIVVTAQRRAESIQKASVPIEVLTAEALKAAGVAQITDLTSSVPGVQVGMGGAAAQVYIRGVGDYGSTAVSNPAVAFNLDGVYLARTQAVGGSLFDLERVEVLKGPQGTLYGRNASGGAINLIPRKPELGTFGGSFDVGVQNYDGISSEGMVNLPIGDKAALRASYQVVNRSGYLSDGSNDDKHQSGRLQALVKPNDDISLRLWGSYTHLGGKGVGYALRDPYGNPAVGRPGTPDISPWTAITSAPANAILAGSPLGLAGLLRPFDANSIHQDIDLWNVHGELNWDLGFATLTFIPSYQHARLDYASIPALFYATRDLAGEVETSSATSIETRLSHESNKLKWVAGLFYYNEDQNAPSSVNNGLIQNLLVESKLGTESYAGFGQLTYSVVDAVRLIAGLRYTHEYKSIDLDRFAVAPTLVAPPASPPCLAPSLADGTCLLARNVAHTSANKLNWRAGIEVDLTPENMLFATAATGFKAGGLSQAQVPAYRPESLLAYEFGSRNRFWDGKLQVNAELFYWLYNDHQELVLGPDDLGLVGAFFRNAGKAKSYGANIDVVVQPTPDDRFHFGLEYMQSRFDSFSYDEPIAFAAGGVTGCQVTPTGAIGPAGPVANLNCSGFALLRAPRWTGSSSYTHIFTLRNQATLEATADVSFASSRWLSVDFTPNSRGPSYILSNFYLTYKAPDDKWQVGAFVRNLTDTPVYTGGTGAIFVPGLYAANLGAPRTYGARFSVNF